MKLRLSILLLAAAALAAAPASAQTIKSLGYNTTNGQVVYSGTNTLRMPDQVKFGTNSAGIVSGSQFLTLLDGGGGVALQLGTNRIIAYDAIDFGGVSGTALSNAATTRTNLGGTTVGNSVFTATNAAAARTAISAAAADGFGVVSNAYKAGILVDFTDGAFGADALSYAGGVWAVSNPTNFRTAIGLGATNAVTFSNITASGTLTTTGNATLSGVNNTMPNATNAASASSLMTRVLTDNNPIQTIGTVRTLGAYAFNTANSGVAAADHAFGGGNVRSGTNTNGYGRAILYRGLNDNNNFTGGGIAIQNMSVSFLWAINDAITTNSFARFIVGGTGTGAVAPANSNALSARGFGVEITRTSTTNVWSAPTLRARLFAHDGTNYYTSSYTDDFSAFNYQHQFIINYTTNGLVTLQTSSSSRAPSRPSATAVLTLTNGPTSASAAFGGGYIEWVAVNRSDIAPAASLHTIYYGGMVEVKD